MIEKCLRLSVFCLMVLLVLLVSLQVFSRYAFNSPTSWSEEAASFTQVFLVFFGGALAIYRKQTLRITFFIDRLPPRFAIIIDLAMRVLVVFFLLAVIWYSLYAMPNLHSQLTVGLRVPKSVVLISLPLGGILMLIPTLQGIHHSYSRLRAIQKGATPEKGERPL